MLANKNAYLSYSYSNSYSNIHTHPEINFKWLEFDTHIHIYHHSHYICIPNATFKMRTQRSLGRFVLESAHLLVIECKFEHNIHVNRYNLALSHLRNIKSNPYFKPILFWRYEDLYIRCALFFDNIFIGVLFLFT